MMTIKNMHAMKRSLVATASWVVAGLSLGCSYASTSADGQTAINARHQASALRFHGTVQALQLSTGELDLLTGVGLALRVVHMRAATGTEISSAGQKITLAQIQVGDIVRAECHHMDADLVMDRIEKLGRFGAEPDAPGGTSP